MKLYGGTSLLSMAIALGCTSPGLAQEAFERRATAEPSAGQVQVQRSVATSRFIVGDVHGALDALNTVGEPRISEIKVEGRVRGRRDVVSDYLGLHEGDVLTAAGLERANRQLADFPTASIGKVRYDLLPDSVIVRPILSERQRAYSGLGDWIPVGVRTAFTRELRLTFSDVTGHSDVWTPSVRWSTGRPRAQLGIAAPAPGFLPGVVRIDLAWQKEHFPIASPGSDDPLEIERTRAGVLIGDWVTAWLRLEGGPAFDRIAGVNALELVSVVEGRGFNDHLATFATGSWFRPDHAPSFATGEFSVSARSTTLDDRPTLSGRTGFAMANGAAPELLWPAAASSSDLVGTLRAHRYYNDGVLVTEAFGRQLIFATVEYVHPLPTRLGPAFLGLAGFVDTAQALSRPQRDDSPVLVDVGLGLRVNASRSGTQLRLDFARNIQDGHHRFSAGYVQPWGRH